MLWVGRIKALPHDVMNWAISCDFELLEASQTITEHRKFLQKNRSSVASLLQTMECVSTLLRCS